MLASALRANNGDEETNKKETKRYETNVTRRSSTKGCVGCEGVPTRLLANWEPRMTERKLQR